MAMGKSAAKNRIREMRQRRDLTQQEVAQGAGLSLTRYHRLEKGTRKLRVEDLGPLADALGCKPEDLIEPADDLSKAMTDKGNHGGAPNRERYAVQPNIGPFRDEEAARRALLDRLICALSPQAIYLFGSRAEGRHRPDSDFDFLVIFPDEMDEQALDYDRAYAPVMGLGVACDIVPCRVSDFERGRHEPDTLARACVTTGSLQYLRHGATLPWLAAADSRR